MTAPRAASDADRSRASGRILAALSVCLLLSWLLLLMPLPWSLGAGLLGIVVAVLLVRACTALWRSGQRGAALFSALLGLGAVVVLLGSTAISILLYGPMHELQECRRSALTQTAQERCQAEVSESTARWLSSLLGS